MTAQTELKKLREEYTDDQIAAFLCDGEALLSMGYTDQCLVENMYSLINQTEGERMNYTSETIEAIEHTHNVYVIENSHGQLMYNVGCGYESEYGWNLVPQEWINEGLCNEN